MYENRIWSCQNTYIDTLLHFNVLFDMTMMSRLHTVSYGLIFLVILDDLS